MEVVKRFSAYVVDATAALQDILCADQITNTALATDATACAAVEATWEAAATVAVDMTYATATVYYAAADADADAAIFEFIRAIDVDAFSAYIVSLDTVPPETATVAAAIKAIVLV